MKLPLSALTLSFCLASAGSFADIRGNYLNESLVKNLSQAPAIDGQDVKVDVVIFYQPSYLKQFGAYEAFNRIESLIKVANDSYKAHNFNYSLAVSDVIPVVSIDDSVPYQDIKDENGNVVKDGANYLFSLAALNAGNPEFELYQNKWKGDLVVYVREMRDEDTLRGLAGIGGEFSSILDDGLETSNNTILAHEIGHNIGLNHEEAEASVGADYARAWLCGGKRTIMYSANNRSSAVLHYSSPLLSLAGDVCGNENADNARVLKENFLSTSLRRDGVESLGTVTFSSPEFHGNEKEGIVIKLQRTGDLSQSASVKLFAENDSAKFGTDFVDAYVVANFEAGMSTTEVVYPMVSDSESEGLESFGLTMKYPYKLSIEGNGSAKINVADNVNSGNPGTFSISGASELNEGDSSTYIVSRTGGVGEAILRVYTEAGDTVAGSDYIALNEQLVFSEGEVEKLITLTTIDDQKSEMNESLVVKINSPSANAEYDVDTVSVNIIDNDEAVELNAGIFSLSASDTTISEAAGSITLTVSRSGGSEGTVFVRVYTVSGTAIAGTDFTALDQKFEFADGEVEKKLTLHILDDSDDESGNTSFDIVLEGADVEVSSSAVTVTLTDNDNASPDSGNTGNSSDEKSGGSMGFLFMLLLSLIAILRSSGFNANKKSI